jgi:hypothetical protein
MSPELKDIKYFIRNIAFGEVGLSKKDEILYEILNNQILYLCKSIPEHMQNKAMFFMLDYSHINIGEKPDFYKNYYKPVWTIIPSVAESTAAKHRLSEPEYETAMCGQAMALFMHSLDDHLNDGEVATSHLLLLLRSQSWILFNNAIAKFADNNDAIDLAHSLINEYYEGMYPDKAPASLDEYCDLFKKEISTWYVVPMLAALKTSGDMEKARDIRRAMEHFGVAWRLLDDIQDCEEDLIYGRHTAFYHLLSADAKKLWDAGTKNKAGKNTDADVREEIFRDLAAGNIMSDLAARILRKLDAAWEAAEALGMRGLAKQYKALGMPVKSILDRFIQERQGMLSSAF